MKLLTIKEAAALLRVTDRTIFNYIQDEKIKPVRIGKKPNGYRAGKTLISESELEHFINQSRG